MSTTRRGRRCSRRFQRSASNPNDLTRNYPVGDGSQDFFAGAAYVFRRTGETTRDAGIKLMAPDAQAGDYFGVSVALSGDCAIVGAHFEDGGDGGPMPDAGAAYILEY